MRWPQWNRRWTRLINGIYKENATGEPRIYPYYFARVSHFEEQQDREHRALFEIAFALCLWRRRIDRSPAFYEQNYPGYRQTSLPYRCCIRKPSLHAALKCTACSQLRNWTLITTACVRVFFPHETKDGRIFTDLIPLWYFESLLDISDNNWYISLCTREVSVSCHLIRFQGFKGIRNSKDSKDLKISNEIFFRRNLI